MLDDLSSFHSLNLLLFLGPHLFKIIFFVVSQGQLSDVDADLSVHAAVEKNSSQFFFISPPKMLSELLPKLISEHFLSLVKLQSVYSMRK